MYHNIRDNKGRFTKSVTGFTPTVSVSVSVPVVNSDKEVLLNKLRSCVYDVKYLDNYGTPITRSLTLMPSYLTGYVGKGTSKKAPTDKVFAYDVDYKMFVAFKVDAVIDMTPV